MKRMGKIRAILLTCALFITPLTVSAALPTEGIWPKTTISANETVNLTGDVTITGLITVSGGSLTINNTSGKPVTIRSGIGEKCFLINSTAAKIDIIGNSESERIIFDGGADYTWHDDSYTLTTTKTIPDDKDHSFIELLSEMNARYVTFRNIYGRHVVNITSNKKSSFRNCVFEKCYGRYVGTALYIGQSTANPTDCAITIEDCVFQNCRAQGYDHEDNKYSGIVRAIGSSSHNIFAKNITMRKNGLFGGGCFCFLSAGHKDVKLVLDGCSFLDNRVGTNGGALWIEGKLEFTGNTTTVSGNYAGWSGGGLYIPTYGGDLITQRTDRVYAIDSKLKISGNSCAGYGGGISFDFKNERLPEGSTVTANIDGAVIENNKAEKGGGGIYFKNATPASKNYEFSINLNSGTFSGNTSPNIGGGIYVESIDVENSGTGTGICNISNNKALNGGGIYIKNGKLVLKETNINKNTATENGGGACIEGGTFAISAGKISENTCTNYGGGVYSSYTGTDYISSSLSGGTVNANSALAGGGICVDGKINFTTTATNIEGNTATNGGGICVINGAKMTYESGLIRNNTAKTTTDMKGQTAFQKGVTDVSGIGGGVFLANNAALSFNVSSDFGLYGNTATNGADDIFANGNGTSISLPDVSSMNLSGYNINLPKNSLYWVEDYITDDANYTSGTYVMGGNYPGTNLGRAYKNWRYRYALDNDEYGFYSVSGTPKTLTCYTSLALGYHLVYITVIKTGMKPGHNAMFKIKSDGASKDYMTFILKEKDKISEQPDGTITLKKRVRLISGTWTVWEDESWSWAYTATEPKTYTRTLNEESSAEDLTFRFSNMPKTNVPQHAEDVKVNTIEL